jgi:polar amino acid transport system substrate-binding protein
MMTLGRSVLLGVWLSLTTGSAMAADKLTIVTEDAPPFSFVDRATGQIAGTSTDVVRKLLAASGIEAEFQLLPWQRAYAMGKDEPNTCVYSTTVTDERKPLFKWVEPINYERWVVYAKPDTAAASIASIDEAKAKGLTIGGYQGDAVALWLKANGFKVDAAVKDSLNPGKLMDDKLDLWAAYESTAVGILAEAKVTGPVKLFAFLNVRMGLACSRQTPDDLVDRMAAALKEVGPKPPM